ncbi:hypothetical protein FHS96_005625 [Sphingomonas zeicaulis]|uniref:hypothetical protein n=1 Tax=Sphingomonas zeicaulis TaxID=1632740 RepID=UPI003D222456
MTNKNDDLIFTEDDWDAAVPAVARDMTAYLAARRAPIFEDLGDHGAGWGSGSFLRLGSGIFILTNEHVTKARRRKQVLTSQLREKDEIWRIIGNHVELPAPYDLALLPVPNSVWSAPHGSTPIEIGQISVAHRPVEGELLAFAGFAGQRVSFRFNNLFSEATCYVAREIGLPTDSRVDSRFHFGIDYRPDLAENVVGNVGLPLPPGLSGSTVWNTNFVAAKMAGRAWTPDLAVVTGVVWGWPSDHGSIVATRAEYVRSFLLQAAKDLGTGI